MQSEPQFATVTLINSVKNNEPTTLRVPISADWTVRQLAKESMRRWVLLKRSADEKYALPVVTQVYVAGKDTQPPADVFAHDVITHVIDIRQEVVFMKLFTQSDSKEENKAVASSTEVVKENTADSYSKKEATVMEKLKEKTVTEHKDKLPKERGDDAKVSYDATRDVKETKTNRTEKKSKVHTPSEERDERKKQSTRNEDEKEKQADQKNEKNRSSYRTGWGKDAHLYFPENYVSSPEKLMSKKRRRDAENKKGDVTKQQSEKEGEKENPKPPKAKKVARQVEFNDVDEVENESKRDTVGHSVTLREETKELPKGWGWNAAKYFDPETYCDDPTKAKLNPKVLSSRYSH